MQSHNRALRQHRAVKRKGKERYTKSQVGYILPIWGADPLGPISTKIGRVVGVHDVINHSKFGFNIFRGFRSTWGQNFRFPIDFAGHRYNSAAATAQPVIRTCCFLPWLISPAHYVYDVILSADELRLGLIAHDGRTHAVHQHSIHQPDGLNDIPSTR